MERIVSRSRGIVGSSRRGAIGSSRGDLAEQLLAVVAVEGGAEGRQLVEGRPEAVDVGPGAERPPAPGLLGAQVAEGPDHVAGLGQVAAVEEAGQAEVGDPEVAGRVEQEVRRLDVAMEDAQAVGVGEGLGRLQGQPGRLARRRGSTPRRPTSASRITAASERPSMNCMA